MKSKRPHPNGNHALTMVTFLETISVLMGMERERMGKGLAALTKAEEVALSESKSRTSEKKLS